jgi:hypothetical protein
MNIRRLKTVNLGGGAEGDEEERPRNVQPGRLRKEGSSGHHLLDAIPVIVNP